MFEATKPKREETPMDRAELLATLTKAAEAGSAIPHGWRRAALAFLEGVDTAGGLASAIQEGERELARVRKMIEDTTSVHATRTAAACADHETAMAEKRMDLTALDAKIADKRRELSDLTGELSESRAFVETQKRVKADLAEHLRKLG